MLGGVKPRSQESICSIFTRALSAATSTDMPAVSRAQTKTAGVGVASTCAMARNIAQLLGESFLIVYDADYNLGRGVRSL